MRHRFVDTKSTVNLDIDTCKGSHISCIQDVVPPLEISGGFASSETDMNAEAATPSYPIKPTESITATFPESTLPSGSRVLLTDLLRMARQCP